MGGRVSRSERATILRAWEGTSGYGWAERPDVLDARPGKAPRDIDGQNARMF